MKSINDMYILIPVLNPDEKFIKVIDDLIQNGFKKIIVVNDGSAEKYNIFFERIKEKAIILRHAVNLGKGRALKTGFNYFLNNINNSLGIITVDSDGQHTVKDIKKIYETMKVHVGKLVLGVRNFNNVKNIPFRSKIGNQVTKIVFGFFTGIKVSDTQTGLRGIPKQYIKYLMTMSGERFEYEMNMLVYTKQYHIDIVEEKIDTIYINSNESSHFNPIKDSFKIYAIFFKYTCSSCISFIIDILLYKIIFNLLIVPLPMYSIIIATIGARIISSVVNFKINKNKVFKTYSKISIIKYYILTIVQMFVSGVIISYLYSIIGDNEVLIKILVDTILFFINFKIQKEWIFRKEKNKC